VYQKALRIVAVVAALALSLPVRAGEPDGYVAFRYAWVDDKDDATAPPRLRIFVTAFAEVKDARLTAKVPAGIALKLRAEGALPTPWPVDGVSVGPLAAGQSVTVELDVAKPVRGGGIVGFLLQGTAAGHALSEGVGVPVGAPGVEPVLRNGALEFPAARGDDIP